ncbi:MAG TPA: DNA primase [Acidimicrobiales bacterium]|nr:DNA primase [Acidimicrobiales bacterium]
MGIVDEDIERVRDAADFVQIVGEVAQLRKVGRAWVGLCPFHSEKSPSFNVNAEQKLYYCYGCQAGGNLFRFVQETQHLDFASAVEWVAGKYGITLRYDNERVGQDRARRQVLTDAMERAVEWYHERLLTSPDAGAARGYLRSRGYGRETVDRFRIGWAPDEWDALARALSLSADVLEDTGLGFKNRVGRLQDSFRARVLFPIFDAAGKPVAFGGRILPGGEGPKYKNSSESKLYSKSRTLYALNWAKEEVSRVDEVIVCEGYTDVIAFFDAGMPRAVATCGTALADEHFRTLKNFATRIVLAYDADAAGQNAASRFYEWEQKYEVEVAVLALPAGADPGDVGREDPEALRRAVREAKPFLEFRLERVLGRSDLSSVERRAKAAEAALDVIAEHPNDFVRDQYVMKVAGPTKQKEEQLRAHLTRLLKGDHRATLIARTTSAPRSSLVGPEIEALRLAVHQPDVVADRLEGVLFADEVNLAAFDALCAASTLDDAIERARPEAAALLQRLAVEEAEADAHDVVRLLVANAAQRRLSLLQAEARAADDPTEYSPTIAWLKVTTEQLWDDATSVGASEQLVAWLVQFGEAVG